MGRGRGLGGLVILRERSFKDRLEYWTGAGVSEIGQAFYLFGRLLVCVYSEHVLLVFQLLTAAQRVKREYGKVDIGEDGCSGDSIYPGAGRCAVSDGCRRG